MTDQLKELVLTRPLLPDTMQQEFEAAQAALVAVIQRATTYLHLDPANITGRVNVLRAELNALITYRSIRR